MFNPYYSTNYAKVVNFNLAADKPMKQGFDSPHVKAQFKYVQEEFKELQFEMDSLGRELSHDKQKQIKANLLKEAADLLYVVYGLFATIGVNADDVFNEVHWSNMSKQVDGKFLKDESGKVIKGPNYQRPDILQFVERN